jgi:hypothetical protein
MNRRTQNLFGIAWRRRSAAGCLWLALWVMWAMAVPAETLRVVAWDLRTTGPGDPASSGPDSRHLSDAIMALDRIKADVIVLHHVDNWAMADGIAEALSPQGEFNVVLCSAFSAATQGQIAILSRRKAYFSWSEALETETKGQSEGGIVFAAIETGQTRVGVFGLQLWAESLGTTAPEAVRRNLWATQWRETAAGFQQWVTNRMEVAVISGLPAVPSDGSVTGVLAEAIKAPFARALQPPARGHDYFACRLASNPETPAAVVLDRAPLICDLEVGPPRSGPPVVTSAGVFLTGLLPGVGAASDPAAADRSHVSPGSLARLGQKEVLIAFGGITALIGVGLLLARRRLRQARLPNLPTVPSEACANTVVMSSSVSGSHEPGTRIPAHHPLYVLEGRGVTNEAERERLRREAATWLKERFVEALANDRSELLSHHERANLRVRAADERLKHIEERLRSQSQVYEERILELDRQLLAAKAESRALIQASIQQLKQEMEAARARLVREAAEPGIASGTSERAGG